MMGVVGVEHRPARRRLEGGDADPEGLLALEPRTGHGADETFVRAAMFRRATAYASAEGRSSASRRPAQLRLASRRFRSIVPATAAPTSAPAMSPPRNRRDRSLSPPSRSARSASEPSGRGPSPRCRGPALRARPSPVTAAFRDCGPSVARTATMPIADPDDRRRDQREVPDREDVMPSRAPMAAPAQAPEHGREVRQRQPSAGVAADEHVDDVCTRPTRSASGSAGRWSRRAPAASRRRARRRGPARVPPGAAIRPPPRHDVAVVQHAGLAGRDRPDRRVGLDDPAAAARRLRRPSPGGPMRSTSGARWRMRTWAPERRQRRRRRPPGGRVGHERDRLERDRRASRGPRAGRARWRWSPGRCATRSAARRARRRGPCAGRRCSRPRPSCSPTPIPSASRTGPGSGAQPPRVRSSSR